MHPLLPLALVTGIVAKLAHVAHQIEHREAQVERRLQTYLHPQVTPVNLSADTPLTLEYVKKTAPSLREMVVWLS